MLDSLPANLMAELRGLVGEEAAIYEPTVHSFRRIALQHQLGKPETTGGEGGPKSILDEGGMKWSLETVGFTRLIKLN
jgi:hypothetical protein